MKTKKLKRDLFIILVSSFIVIILWIGFSIYNSAVTSTIDETLTKQIIPIAPSFDTAMVEKLKSRKNVSPIYELAAVASDDAELTPTPTQIEKEESPIPEITQTPREELEELISTPTPELLEENTDEFDDETAEPEN